MMLSSAIFLLSCSLATCQQCDEGPCLQPEPDEHDVPMVLLQTSTVVEPEVRHSNNWLSNWASLLSKRTHTAHRKVHKQEPIAANVADDATAAVSGVTLNGRGDLSLFISGCATNTAMLLCFMFAFVMLRSRYPEMFTYGFISGRVPVEVPGDWTSWISSSLKLEMNDHIKYAGLDHAMLLEFCNLSMRLCAYIGVPMVCIMSPLYYLFGHGQAEEDGDNLTLIAMGNVKFLHPWLYYVDGVVVLLVCWITKRELFKSMDNFCLKRFEWLESLPSPQATSIMIEGIPESHRSETKLWEYFSQFFAKDDIRDIHIVMHIPELENTVAKLEAAELALTQAQVQWEKDGKDPAKRPKTSFYHEDALECYEKAKNDAEQEAEKLRDALENDHKTPGGVNASTAFVTFENALDCSKAVGLNFSPHKDEWLISLAPPPGDLIWSDMKVSEEGKSVKRVLGYAAVFGLYASFTPVCLLVTNLASMLELGPLQSIWDTYAPTMGLLIFLSFVPTVLILIFSFLFNFKCEVNVQVETQNWYFWFLFFFVILVTAIGQGFSVFVEEISERPFDLPLILADKMPAATHYYLTYLSLQWVTHGMNLMRYIQVGKFIGFSKLLETEEARAMSEPEDQDYYGMGSRSARFTSNLLIALIFGTLSPLMSLLAWINFWVCRVIYGYLMVWAETKKADSGGVFFVNQLKHTLMGLIFYTLLMAGIFIRRAPDYVPAGCAIAAAVFAVHTFYVFSTKFNWETLSAEEAIKLHHDHSASDDAYIQPEIIANTSSKDPAGLARKITKSFKRMRKSMN
eukprot:TRINITY_DN798_c0_g1_i2.p1 TRINITY_DN798_c0_g1~~TRINITY_DN798_c0_g1_i2.p1  ORF type:complete len:797 (+),score=140.85 TRINITY_DN798_c0_g1_i2:1761-4151(+)